MSKISFLDAKEISDSRGESTIEVTAGFENGAKASAAVPCGKSTGKFEAVNVSTKDAITNVGTVIKEALIGKDIESHETADKIILELDGTKNKERLGANSILGVSLAVTRLVAAEKGMELWEYIAESMGISKEVLKMPRLLANVINGGAHAKNNLDFQEYLFITNRETAQLSYDLVNAFYTKLGERLMTDIGEQAKSTGDEGGYAPNFQKNVDPFTMMASVAEDMKIKGGYDFGMDVAANNIESSKDELYRRYIDIKQKVHVAYIEDPFREDDADSFKKLFDEIGGNTIICGDDITVTNESKIEEFSGKGMINGVIIKPNQIGTFSETLKAIKKATENNIKVIVSHRSGETNDTFVSDLAYGAGAFGFKLGVPVQKERVVKYERIIEIENSR